jgi:hypothetical protein
LTYKQQGDVGVAKAIFYYTASGYTVSIPNTDNSRYDLVVEKKGKFSRVQVKTTTYKSEYGIYQAALKTSGGNRTGKGKVSYISSSEIDLLFVLTETGTMYEIPVNILKSKSSVSLGRKFDNYMVQLNKW